MSTAARVSNVIFMMCTNSYSNIICKIPGGVALLVAYHSISRVFPGGFSQDFKSTLHVCLQPDGVDRISSLHLFQKSYERTPHAACAVCPEGIGGNPFEARQQ